MAITYTFKDIDENVLCAFLQSVNRFNDNERDVNLSVSLLDNVNSTSIRVNVVRADFNKGWQNPHELSVCLLHD